MSLARFADVLRAVARAAQTPALDRALLGWRLERTREAHARADRYIELAWRAEWRKRRADAWAGALWGAGTTARVAEFRRKAKWWRRRSNVRRFAERVGACGVDRVRAVCKGCGVVEHFERTCGCSRICDRCTRQRYKRMRRRLLVAISAAAKREHDAGRPSEVVVLTLTVRHAKRGGCNRGHTRCRGGVGCDRRLLSEAWNRWRTWYARHYGNKLVFWWVPEITAGWDSAGHAHLHVITFFPSYIDYTELVAEWSRATGDTSRLHVSRRDDGAVTYTPEHAARYLAKYVTKGVDGLPVDVAADWTMAAHGRRGVSASYGAWAADFTPHAYAPPPVIPLEDGISGPLARAPGPLLACGAGWRVEQVERSRAGP